MKKLLTIGFVTLAMFFGLSLVVYADGGLILADDGEAVEANGDVGLDYIYDLKLRNGTNTADLRYIYRGQAHIIWSYFRPSIRCVKCKLKLRAKFTENSNIKFTHVNTKLIKNTTFSGSASGFSCEPWARFNQRVPVKSWIPGYSARTEVWYTR